MVRREGEPKPHDAYKEAISILTDEGCGSVTIKRDESGDFEVCVDSVRGERILSFQSKCYESFETIGMYVDTHIRKWAESKVIKAAQKLVDQESN